MDDEVTLEPAENPWAQLPAPNGVPRVDIGPPSASFDQRFGPVPPTFGERFEGTPDVPGVPATGSRMMSPTLGPNQWDRITQNEPVNLEPVEGNPYTEPMTGATPAQLKTGGDIAIGAGQHMVNLAAAPGNVTQGQQPTTPGMWSDEDEALAQANARGQYGWGPEVALNAMGVGGAIPAETNAVNMGLRGFRSGLRDAVEASKMNVGTPQQWLGEVKGAKPEELDWTGLQDWLQNKTVPNQQGAAAVSDVAQNAMRDWRAANPGQKPPQELIDNLSAERKANQDARGQAASQQQVGPAVTKQEVLDYLDQNQVNLEEKRYGQDPERNDELRDIGWRVNEIHDRRNAIQDEYNQLHEQDVSAGRQYTEGPEDINGPRRQQLAQEDEQLVQELGDLQRKVDTGGNPQPKYQQYSFAKGKGGQNYQESVITMPPKPLQVQYGDPQPFPAKSFNADPNAPPLHKFGTPEEQNAAMDRLLATRARVRNFSNADMGGPEWQMAVYEHNAAEAAMKDIVPGWGRPPGPGTAMWNGTRAVEGVTEIPFRVGSEGSYEGKIMHWPQTYRNDKPAGEKWVVNHPNMQNAQFNSLEEAKSALESRAQNFSRDDVYTHGHWRGETNPILHTRYDERSIGGDKTLHMSEGQSDWHLTGKKQGYIGSPEHIEAGKIQAAELGYSQAQIAEMTPDQLKSFVSRGVPEAPFVRGSWPDLAMKHMLYKAAERGADRLTWDTGKTNADRYSLSTYFDKIKSSKMQPTGGGDNYRLEAFKKGDDRGQMHEMAAEELPDFVGKDLARQIVEHHTPSDTRYYGPKEWTGDNLYTGGRGKRTLYDEIFPKSAVNELKKKGFDAKVESAEMPDPQKASETSDMLRRGEIAPDEKSIADHKGEWDDLSNKVQWVQQKRSVPVGAEYTEADLPPKYKLEEHHRAADDSLAYRLTRLGDRTPGQVTVNEGLGLHNTKDEGVKRALEHYHDELYEQQDALHGKMVKETADRMRTGATTTVHSVKLTPDMRQKILSEGFSLFANKSAALGGLAASDDLWHGISNVKLPKPISEMNPRIVGGGGAPEKLITPSDLQGGLLMPARGDRSIQGGQLTGFNGFNFENPVELQGGHGYMAANSPRGSVWASQKGIVSGLTRKAGELAETGKPVYFPYTAMGEQSVDSSHHISDALSQAVAQSKITPANAQLFDQVMKKGSTSAKAVEDWPGVMAPNLQDYLRNAPGRVRRAFAQEMDKTAWQKRGFPSVAEARHAVTDPRLLNEPTGATGLSISQLHPDRPLPEAQHNTYPVGMPGTYKGGFGMSLPKEAVYPDIMESIRQYQQPFVARKAMNPRAVVPRADDLMGMTPPGVLGHQEANQKWVDMLSRIIEQKRQRGE